MVVAIAKADAAVLAAAYRRLDMLTKPLGALGRLETLAAQICAAQKTLTPSIAQPIAVVFAADQPDWGPADTDDPGRLTAPTVREQTCAACRSPSAERRRVKREAGDSMLTEESGAAPATVSE